MPFGKNSVGTQEPATTDFLTLASYTLLSISPTLSQNYGPHYAHINYLFP